VASSEILNNSSWPSETTSTNTTRIQNLSSGPRKLPTYSKKLPALKPLSINAYPCDALHKIPIGLVRDLPDKRSVWAEVERLHLPINPVDSRRGVTFGELVLHYAEHELVERSESIHPKAHTTIKGYDCILRNRLLPKWGSRIALGIEPLEVEEWLTTPKREEELENPTLDRLRRVMSLVYRHGQRYGLIPRTQESHPMRFVRCKTTSGYEAMIITPEQAYAIVRNLREPESTLTLLAAGTGLRISECLGTAMAGCKFCGGNDSCASHVDVWPSGFA
jgi:hypothetical protein